MMFDKYFCSDRIGVVVRQGLNLFASQCRAPNTRQKFGLQHLLFLWIGKRSICRPIEDRPEIALEHRAFERIGDQGSAIQRIKFVKEFDGLLLG